MAEAREIALDVALEVVEVRRSYGSVVAVAGASFQVRRGEIVSLLGPSGCGKTTTLRMIAGFEEPDEGSIRIAGKDMRGLRPYERNVGLLFQDYALFPHMTVERNVVYGLKHRGIRGTEAQARVQQMLRLVRLEGFERRYPRQLSGGQQQRVALARAMAIEPEVVLLDEPLSALDAKLREQLRVELKQILTEANATTIVVTHDQEEAMSLSDRIIVMRSGEIMQQGTPEEIYSKPRNRFVADFIGRSNWFEGRAQATGNGATAFETERDGCLAAACALPSDEGALLLGVRPERIVHLNGSGGGPSGQRPENVLQGTLVSKEFLGADIHLRVRLASGKMIHAIEKNSGLPIAEEGEPLILGFHATDCLLVPE